MTAQELAHALLQLLPKVNLPITPENIAAAGRIYHTLGQMAQGQLILLPPAPPPKD